MKKVRFWVILVAAVLTMAGCGGSWVDDLSKTTQMKDSLARYSGTWAGCADYKRVTVTLTESSATTLNWAMKQEWFTTANCAEATPWLTVNYSNPAAVLTFQKTGTITLEDPITYPAALLGSQSVDLFRVVVSGVIATQSGVGVAGSTFQALPDQAWDAALYLSGDVLMPINVINNNTLKDSGQWHADQVTLTKVN